MKNPFAALGLGRLGGMLQGGTLSFGRFTAPMLGVDIGTDSVKVMEVSRRDDGYSVDAYAVEPLPAEALTPDGQIPDPGVVGEVVARAVKHSGSRARCAALAVPATLAMDKVVQMSAALREQDMEAQLRAEFDQHLPLPLADVQIDFIPLGPAAGDETSVDVLLVASRKEHVEARTAAVEMAGLEVQVMDVETRALADACSLLRGQIPDDETCTTVLVDIGATRTSVVVLNGLRQVYAHHLLFGARGLTQRVSAHFNLDPAAAEQGQRSGRLPDEYALDILPQFHADLAQQIQRALQYFDTGSASGRHASISQVLLAGGGARIPDLAPGLKAHLHVEVGIADPFSTVKFGPRLRSRQMAEQGPALLLTAGLALRAFDERH